MSGHQRKLDEQYAAVMENHPFGVALYRPLPTSILRPGSLGYFDEFGAWNLIAHLAEGPSLLAKGLGELEGEIAVAPPDDGIKWGPKISSGTKATKVELSGGIDLGLASGIPLTVSAVYSYSTTKDVGAILLTSAPITYERYFHSNIFKKWVQKNALAILAGWPEVKDHDLWIVTSTFSTKKCAINMWNSHSQGIKVGFTSDIWGIGNAGPSADWVRSQTDEGWAEYSTKGNEKYAVFFGGLKFHYSRLLSGMGMTGLNPRGGPSKFNLPKDPQDPVAEYITSLFDPENDEYFDVHCEEIIECDVEGARE